jgi:hypothetical protein
MTFYFDINKYKLKDQAKLNLDEFIIDFDYLTVDSIQFIGYADTTGNYRSNMRLSEKRAKSTERYCSKIFKIEIPTSSYAKGEGTKKNLAENRKVDMVIFQQPPKIPKTEIIEDIDPNCFTIEQNMLNYCTYRTIIKRKKEYVFIESEHNKNLQVDYNKLYYVVAQKDGKATIRRVKWKLKRTGRLWWEKKRYTATVPKRYFDLFKLFSIQPGPCDECSEEALGKDSIFRKGEVPYPDMFLNYNFQMKYGFFRKSQVKIRAPREYIDLDETYYYQFQYKSGIVNWTTKRGKRKRDYYYLNLPLSGERMPYFKKLQPFTICTAAPSYEGGFSNPTYRPMGPCMLPVTHNELNLETGIFYQNDTLTGYLAGGFSNTTRNTYASLIGGINSNLRFYGSARFQYFFFNFPLHVLSPTNRWETPAMQSPLYKFGRLYVGFETKTSFREDYMQFFEQNVHLGIARVNTNETLGMRRIFLQSGFANDFLNISTDGIYPFVQFGATFQFYGFWYR